MAEPLGDHSERYAGGQHQRRLAVPQVMQAHPSGRPSAQWLLVTAHLREGSLSEALGQLGSYRRLLADELGLRTPPRFDALLALGKDRQAPAVRSSPHRGRLGPPHRRALPAR